MLTFCASPSLTRGSIKSLASVSPHSLISDPRQSAKLSEGDLRSSASLSLSLEIGCLSSKTLIASRAYATCLTNSCLHRSS